MEIEKNDVLNWLWNFRPDLTVDEDFVEGLHQEFLQANNKLSLDEISFYGFVVSNYKSEIIDFIYKTLEENWSGVYEIGKQKTRQPFTLKT